MIYFSIAPRAASAAHEIQYGALPWSEIVDVLIGAPGTPSTYEIKDHDGTDAGLKAAKLSCAMISPATFVVGESKHERNVTGVHWLMLDFDDVTPATFLHVLGKLEAEGIAAFCYSTWSQPEAAQLTGPDGTVGLVRARVGMPISRPCSRDEWRNVHGAAVAKYGASATDASCTDPSRFYFVPALPRGAEAHAQTWRASGQSVVDVDSLVREWGGAARARNLVIVTGTDPVPRDALVRLASRWGRSDRSEDLRAAHLLKTALEGYAFAVIGQRHAAKLTLSMRLAAAFPTGNASQISEYFRQSFDIMRDGSENQEPVDKFVGLLESAQAKIQADTHEAEAKRVLLTQTNLVKAWEGMGYVRDTPYSPDELDAATKYLGLIHPSELSSRWIVQCRDWIHLLFIDPQVGPQYLPPVSRSAITTSVIQNLAPASSTGFTGYTFAKDGTAIPKTLDRLISEYGRVVHHEEMSLIAKASYLDARRSCLVTTCAPLVNVDPEYDEEVDAWLALLAGDKDPQCVASRALRGTKAARLSDWLAVATDLSKPAPALYFKGGAGSGKTLFAEALARLWRCDTPTSLSQLIGQPFNAAITRCPVVLGDEKIPETFKGEPRTEELRELITKSNFELNRKNRDLVTCRGSIRMILCANNFNMITKRASFTPEDAQALADRFILLEPHAHAREFLIQMGARAWGDEVAEGLRFAKHVLWLRAQNEAGIRPIERGSRLYVPGDASLLTDALQTASHVPWSVCYWLWSFLRNPVAHITGSAGRPLAALVTRGDAFADGAALWVNAEQLVQCWDHYLSGERAPGREALLGALRNVADGRSSGRLRRDHTPVHGTGRTRVEYVRIRLEALVQWAERNGDDTADLSVWLASDTESLGMPGKNAGGNARPN